MGGSPIARTTASDQRFFALVRCLLRGGSQAPRRSHPPDGAFFQTRYNPARFHSSSTFFFTSADISIRPGQGRVKPSVGHLRVASIPIFEP